MRKKVYTTGVFDILHRGHLNILTQAASLGDLIVGIQTDKGVEECKGRHPILSIEERIAQLESMPFVSKVIPYRDTNQIPMYESIKPDILVQGDDWLISGNRSRELEYIQRNDLRLILLPRTEGISTTEIRKRVQREGRRDETFLLEHVKLVPIEDLRLYEEFEEAKVQKLVEKIKKDGVFHNPISIVRELIVIDGNNRLEALRRIGAKFVPAVIYDYKDIDLVGNVHFVKNGKKTRLSEFAREEGKKIEFRTRTPQEIIDAADQGKMIPNGETFHRVPQSVIRLPIKIGLLMSPGFNMEEFLKEKIENGMIRFYQTGVYVCDEW